MCVINLIWKYSLRLEIFFICVPIDCTQKVKRLKAPASGTLAGSSVYGKVLGHHGSVEHA